jgi:hypothetical protein
MGKCFKGDSEGLTSRQPSSHWSHPVLVSLFLPSLSLSSLSLLLSLSLSLSLSSLSLPPLSLSF